MMKAAACVMILLSSASLGWLIRARLSKRLSALDEAILLVGMIETRISYFLEPLDAVLAVIRVESPLMHDAVGAQFQPAWNATFSCAESALRASDRQIMLRFGASLGASDAQGQRALCANTREALRRARQSAAEEKARFSRIGAVLPVFIGAAVILMFI